ncbi:hypothetical protein EW146_g6374 [Bondarzewia mesenterica]|uniref:Elongation factor 1 alpha-like protein n=1 Tax=Bondarzewia mesenterica TaxID=1095465 RepID=A0A4S4LNP4_9AGAM|nr:hypothetical protein EW146_g6374 [Bondarzewia mesenterica]
MSRHRFVRNLDLDDERDDGALSDGGEDDMTPDEQAQMESGFEHIRAVIGSETESGINDSTIQSTLWDCYFNVEKSIEWLLEEQSRRNAARERKEERARLGLPESPSEDVASAHLHASRLALARSAGATALPNVPLIAIAQQNEQEFLERPESFSSDAAVPRAPLSIITERTEVTEGPWTPVQESLVHRTSRISQSSTSTSSYGQVIDSDFVQSRMLLPDPNEIQPSPSPSALKQLSMYESPPSVEPSASRSPVTPPLRPPSVPLPPLDSIPDISDNQSKSSRMPASQKATPVQVFRTPRSKPPIHVVDKPLPDLPPPTEPRYSQVESLVPPSSRRQSKLSALATSRAASSRASTFTKSSRLSSSSVGASSILTYPALRPSSESELSFADGEEASVTSTSSHIRRAIQTALDQEAVDRIVTPGSLPDMPVQSPSLKHPLSVGGSKLSRTASTSSKSTVKPVALTLQSLSRASSVTTPSDGGKSSTKERTPSKLAKLAEAKSKQTTFTPKPKPPRSPSPNSLLHTTRTEYLTPIANGPTATTAITTSYQSLNHLISPARSALPPSFPPHDYKGGVITTTHTQRRTSSSESKQSKLAMKVKKLQQKYDSDATVNDEASPPDPVPTMFLPEASRSCASPSAFASLLVYEETLTSAQVKGHRREKREKTENNLDKAPQGRRRSRSGTRSRSRSRSHSRSGAVPMESVTEKMTKPRSQRHRQKQAVHPAVAGNGKTSFGFDVPSPDDIVSNARRGTSLAPAKEREKAQRLAAQRKIAESVNTPAKGPKGAKYSKSGTSTPVRIKSGTIDQRQLDIAALNLGTEDQKLDDEEPPQMSLAREKVLEEARKALEAEATSGRKGVSLVVIGHVDAGKSTLMGRLLYELGRVDEKRKLANERASDKIGKGSFSWAWELDGTSEERERGITMDVALQTLETPHRHITILDAPGHKDFIPNMISGASQADCALLVVDASTGEFEAGFERGGQTREHLVLVRSLGVAQVIVAVNKLDQVEWSQDRYEDVCSQLKAFLVQSGFHPSKTHYVPVGAMTGVNLLDREGPDAKHLSQWYSGTTLVDLLDVLQPPTRDITTPLRFPISNVFKGQGSSTGVSGRICGGIVQVGERLRILPGDETAIVKSIETELESLPWAAAGTNVTLYLTAVDPIHLSIGSVLCPPAELIPLASTFTARIIVFDIQVPILAGTSVELFHHSRDVPASISKLNATLDRASGKAIKKNPRVLTKGTSAEVQITIRPASLSGPATRAQPIPLEPFSVSKEMGRVLIRRGGETIGAGIVLEILS